MLRDFNLARIAPKKNMLELLHAYMTLNIERINHKLVRLIHIGCYRTQGIDLRSKSKSNGRVIGYSTVSNTDLRAYM